MKAGNIFFYILYFLLSTCGLNLTLLMQVWQSNIYQLYIQYIDRSAGGDMGHKSFILFSVLVVEDTKREILMYNIINNNNLTSL